MKIFWAVDNLQKLAKNTNFMYKPRKYIKQNPSYSSRLSIFFKCASTTLFTGGTSS
jgi:hypothetical protein